MIITAFFWDENPWFPVPAGSEIVIFILLYWSLELIDYQLQPPHFTDVETGPERLRDKHKVTQQGKCKVRTNSVRAFSITLYILCHLEKVEITNGYIGKLESRLFPEICVHTDGVSYTDLNFDPSGS